MKKKPIYKICKDSKAIVLMNKVTDDGTIYEQWIGDGHAAYLHENMPVYDTHTAPELLDLPKEKKENFNVAVKIINSDELFADERLESDIPMKKSEHVFDGYITFTTDNSGYTKQPERTVFVDYDYTRPLIDKDEMISWYYRRVNGKEAIIAADGFILKAVILPVKFECSTLSRNRLEWLETVVAELRMEVES